MACKVERHATGALKSMTFSCDAEGCAAPSPTDTEIMAAGGLQNMGWHCSGGAHLCPDHNPNRETTNV